MPYWNQNRYVNVSSIHRDGQYIKFLVALEEQAPQGASSPFMREVVADCGSKTRVELLGSEIFTPALLKTYFPGTIIGSETQFACDEAARQGMK